MKHSWLLALLCLIFIAPQSVVGQDSISTESEVDSQKIYRRRLALVTAGGGITYTAALIGLNELWYKNYPRSSFHFINDNRGWLQVDKLGHFYTAYYESEIIYRMLLWSGVDKKKAGIYGGMGGFILQTPIEILDGFSAQWGASTGDIIANAAGSAIYIGQHLLFNEQLITFKFSAQLTPYAAIRPDQMGTTPAERFLKDYNGQTYWALLPLQKLTGIKKIPDFLCLGFGYGATGMLGANGNGIYGPESIRARQYYFSLGFDTRKFKSDSKFGRTLLKAISLVKIPMPTLEFNKNDGIVFHPLYF